MYAAFEVCHHQRVPDDATTGRAHHQDEAEHHHHHIMRLMGNASHMKGLSNNPAGQQGQPYQTSITLVSSPAKRSSPGLKDFVICFMTALSLPAAMTLSTKGCPEADSKDSIARSFLTETDRPGGSKDAWHSRSQPSAFRLVWLQ